MTVDPDRFGDAVASASSILDQAQDSVYSDQIFVDYTAHIIRQMGGTGAQVAACAMEMFREWAACQHFVLYDDVAECLRALAARALTIGLISNSHRCLESFQSHFELEGLIDVAISSSQHGYMKPHPSIFKAALTLAGVEPAEAVMVGDSLAHDIDGARRVGMKGVLVRRSGGEDPLSDVPVVTTLRDLPSLVP
jgi:HAD superfamily hydrolase (TIGR01509 family)